MKKRATTAGVPRSRSKYTRADRKLIRAVRAKAKECLAQGVLIDRIFGLTNKFVDKHGGTHEQG